MTSAFNQLIRTLAALALAFVALSLVGCSSQDVPDLAEETPAAEAVPENEAEPTPLASTAGEDAEAAEEPAESDAAASSSEAAPVADTLSFRDVAAYSGNPYVYVNDGEPAFTDEERAAAPGTERYGELDELGRCTATFAVVGTETMPTEERGSIGEVKPSGWQMAKYDFVDGKYLYNRCHLLGYQLTGENANTKNLITGTRYLNIDGMLPFENAVADYVDATGNHVLMRVTPVFEGSELVARGVHMMAESVEDGGDGVSFNVFCYNVQPGVVINYGTGENVAEENATPLPDVSGADSSAAGSSTGAGAAAGTSEKGTGDTASDTGKTAQDYVLNTNSKKFHVPGCSSVGQMKDKNRQDVNDTRENIIAQGYDPCKRCNP